MRLPLGRRTATSLRRRPLSTNARSHSSASTPAPRGSAVAHLEAIFAAIAPILAGREFIVGGDFNSCRLAERRWRGYRHLEFFEGLEARGFHNCFYSLHEREQRTYFGGGSWPLQDDHLFVSPGLAASVAACDVLDYDPVSSISDHAVLWLELAA